MRTLLIATAVIAISVGTPAAAQSVSTSTVRTSQSMSSQSMSRSMPQVRTSIPRGGWTRQPMPNRPQVNRPPSRWGGATGGRWQGGVQAPGGWNAYRRPSRGWTLPSYWYSPGFFIGNWSSYGLGVPPVGYTWSRYYDDAVLVDDRGRIYDSVSGIDWDRDDRDHAYDGAAGRDGYGADYDRDDDRDGRHYQGAGRGPGGGDAGRGPGGYPPPPHGDDGRAYRHGGYWYGGAYYAGGTTVTIQPTVTTTTTTIEYIYEDAPVRYKRVYRAKPKARSCRCSKTLSR